MKSNLKMSLEFVALKLLRKCCRGNVVAEMETGKVLPKKSPKVLPKLFALKWKWKYKPENVCGYVA